MISDNEGTTTVVPLVRDEITIGRKDGNTIRLTERNISRHHASLTRVDDGYLLRDLDSYNGVVLNSRAIVGEAAIAAGDEIQLGDYTLTVQAEVAEIPDISTEVSETEPTTVKKLPRVPRPARLIVFGPVSVGAEFTIPHKGQISIGRAPEADVTLDHRSVSREHAVLTVADGVFKVTDQSSANGLLLNGEPVGEAELRPGAMLELGEVVLRFVGADEKYVFDPSEASMLMSSRGKSRRPVLLAAVIVAAAAAAALAIVFSGGAAEQPEVATAIGPAPASPPGTESAEPTPPTEPAPSEQAIAPAPPTDFPQLLAACREAVAGARFAEAMAHASAALKLKPESSEAAACHMTAKVNHEEEQAFVRGKAALEGGDAEAAYEAFAGLSPQSLFRVRPEVAAATEALGRSRIDQARVELASSPGRAAKMARSVTEIATMPLTLKEEAQALVDEAKAAQPTAKARTRRGGKSAKSAAASAARGEPSQSPMEIAKACVARGDNSCVIRALNGRARTAQELGLLIETYRAVGNAAQAERNMNLYVQRFPTAKKADYYRRLLGQ
ncbi:MAG: FHA domain-containing protein [Myxococcales bacterium]|nr:FHA domain-containing protein [Myxococcales bacterium]